MANDKDPLGILGGNKTQSKPTSDPLGILDEPLKKKEPTQSVAGGGLSQIGGSISERSSQLESPSPSEDKSTILDQYIPTDYNLPEGQEATGLVASGYGAPQKATTDFSDAIPSIQTQPSATTKVDLPQLDPIKKAYVDSEVNYIVGKQDRAKKENVGEGVMATIPSDLKQVLPKTPEDQEFDTVTELDKPIKDDSYLYGTVDAMNNSFFGLLHILGGAEKLVGNGIDAVFGTNYYSDENYTPVFSQAANYLSDQFTGNMGNMPQTTAGKTLETLGALPGFIAGTMVAPELKLLQLGKLTNGAVTTMPKVTNFMTAQGGFTAYNETGKIEDFYGGAWEGFKEGAFLHMLGGVASKSRMLSAQPLDKAILQHGIMGGGFGASAAAQGGDMSDITAATLAGVAFGFPEVSRAMGTYYSASPTELAMAQRMKITPESQKKIEKQYGDMRAKAETLRSEITTEPNVEIRQQKQDLLTTLNMGMQGMENAIATKAVADVVAKHPAEFIREIRSDETLTPSEQQHYVDKVNETVYNAIPESVKKLSEEVDKLQSEVNAINDNPKLPDAIKQSMVAEKQAKIDELSGKIAEELNAPKEKEEEAKNSITAIDGTTEGVNDGIKPETQAEIKPETALEVAVGETAKPVEEVAAPTEKNKVTTESYSYKGKNIIKGEEYTGLTKDEAINRILQDEGGNTWNTLKDIPIDDVIDKNTSSMWRFDRYSKRGRELFDKIEGENEYLSKLKEQGFKTLKEYGESKLQKEATVNRPADSRNETTFQTTEKATEATEGKPSTRELSPEEKSNLTSIEESSGKNFREIQNVYNKYGEGKPLNEITLEDYNKAEAKRQEAKSTQEGIKPTETEQITPERVQTEVEKPSGIDAIKQITDKIRSLKSDKSKVYDATLGLPIAVWDGMLETVAKTIEAGGDIASAISDAVKYLRANKLPNNNINEVRDYLEKELGYTPDVKPSKKIMSSPVENININPKEVRPNIKRSVTNWVKDNFKPGRNAPKGWYMEKLYNNAAVRADLVSVENRGRELESSIKEAYGKNPTKEQLTQVNDALQNNIPLESIENISLRSVVKAMREDVDRLSVKIKDLNLLSKDLNEKIESNLGYYITRAYSAFVEKGYNWNRIPEKAKTNLFEYLRRNNPEWNDNMILREMKSMLENPNSFADYLETSQTKGSSSSVLKARKDVPLEIREFLGEIKDPLFNYTNTMSKMTTVYNKLQLMEKYAKLGQELGVLTTKENAKPDMTETFGIEDGKLARPLNSLYTTPELKQFILDRQKVSEVDGFMKAWVMLNGIGKYSKTILSPTTIERNFTSGLMAMVANGHLTGTKNLGKGFRFGLGINLKAPEVKAKYDEYVRNAIVGGGAMSGEMKAILRDYSGKTDATEIIRSLNAKRKTLIGKPLSEVAEFYQAMDDIVRITIYESEKSRLKDAYPNKPEAEIARDAADITARVYQNYDLVPKAVQYIRKFPFVGTFVSFPAESMRIAYNTYDQAVREMKDPKTRAIGAKRMAGALTMTAGYYALAEMGKSAFGVSDDDEENLRRHLPKWNQNSDLLVTGKDKDGNIEYVDLSQQDLYNVPRKVIKNIYEVASGQKPTIDGLIETAEVFFEPYITEEMVTARLLDVRSNKRSDTGRTIYNPAEGFGENLKDVLLYVGESLEPGASSSARRMYKAITGKVAPSGKVYDLDNEVLAVTSGIRKTKTNLEQSMYFKAQDFADKDLPNARKIYNSLYYSKTEKTDEELNDAYKSANESVKKYFNDLVKDYNSALDLGQKRDAIEQKMKDAGMSKNWIEAVRLGVPIELDKTPDVKESTGRKKRQKREKRELRPREKRDN